MSSNFERDELIRKGNQALDEKDYPKARDFFIKADYKLGLVRIGDYYMHEKHLPLLAYGYYKKADAEFKMEDLRKRMLGVIAQWIGHDKLRSDCRDDIIPKGISQLEAKNDTDEIKVFVDPLLKSRAEKILSQNNSSLS